MTKNSRFGSGWDGLGGFLIGFFIGSGLVGILLVCVIFRLSIENEGLHNKIAELEAENATIECNTRIKVYNEFRQGVAEGFVITLNNGGAPKKEVWCNAKPILPRCLGVLVEDAKPLGWSVTIVDTNKVVSSSVYHKMLAGEMLGGVAGDEAKDEAKDEPNYFGWYTCDLTFDCMCAKCRREQAIDNMLKSMESRDRNFDEITNLIDKIMCNLGIKADGVAGKEETNE